MTNEQNAAPDTPEDRETMKRDFERDIYKRAQQEDEQNALEEVEHTYSIAAADWASLKQDFLKANRSDWAILCDHGLRNLETLHQLAQELVGETVSQTLQMIELRDQRDRAMEAHVAALRRLHAAVELANGDIMEQQRIIDQHKAWLKEALDSFSCINATLGKE